MIIDKANGRLILLNNFTISGKTTPADLWAYFGADDLNAKDHRNGWIAFNTPNIKLEDTFFLFTFYVEYNILQLVEFTLAETVIIPDTWDNWSKETEMKKRDEYDKWLTKEIGPEREFDWGAIAAHHDAKAGVSNIILRYKR